MDTPAQHKALLQRVGYPIDPLAELDPGEGVLITKFGYWLEAIATGALAPITDEQRHFLVFVRGETAPQSPHERAWVKLKRAPARPIGPKELFPRVEALHAARRNKAEVETEYTTRRAAVMERLQPELAAIDAEFLDRLRLCTEEVARRETVVREAVLRFGKSFRHAGIYAMYARGRVTWDSKGLEQYATAHPDVVQFRKVGKPVVSLRALPPDSPTPDEGVES